MKYCCGQKENVVPTYQRKFISADFNIARRKKVNLGKTITEKTPLS